MRVYMCVLACAALIARALLSHDDDDDDDIDDGDNTVDADVF